MAFFRFRPLLLLLLLATAACYRNKDVEPAGLTTYNGLPYYYFTLNDQDWLQLRSDDVWRFANAQGRQRAYAVSIHGETRVANRELAGPGRPGNSGAVVNYYDYQTVRLTPFFPTPGDSGQGGGELRFYRYAARRGTLRPEGYNVRQSRLYAEGEWDSFVGNTDLRSDDYQCRGLRFPTDPDFYRPFDTLTVGGRRYTEVIAFIGTSRGPACAPLPGWGLQELYYDRRAGLVRLVTLAGERWDRVP